MQLKNSFVSIVLRFFEHPFSTYSYVNDTMIVRQHKIFIFGVYGSSSLRNRTKRLYKLIVVYINVGEIHEFAHFLLQKSNRLNYISYIYNKVDLFYMASNFGTSNQFQYRIWYIFNWTIWIWLSSYYISWSIHDTIIEIVLTFLTNRMLK